MIKTIKKQNKQTVVSFLFSRLIGETLFIFNITVGNKIHF